MRARIRVPQLGAELLPDTGISDEVRLSVADDMALGYPRYIVLVPVDVEQNGTTAKAQISLAADAPPPRGWPVKRNGQKDGIYTFGVSVADWPRGGNHVLALLYFDQQEAGPTHDEVTTAAAAFLDGGNPGLKTLRSGLVPQFKGKAGDQPKGKARDQPRAARPTPQAWRFVLASCQYPHDVLDRSPEPEIPSVDHEGPADRSMVAMAELFAAADPPAMLLQCGDQVYVDATAGLFDPTTLYDRFRRPYTLLRQSRGRMALQLHLPRHTYRLIDDHEINDNWAQGDDQEALWRGAEAYWQFQRGVGKRPLAPNALYQDITPGPCPFFLADTRTQRMARTALDYDTQLIMDSAQEAILCNWLNTNAKPDRPCFVASPAAVLPRPLALLNDPHAALHCDSWAGYPRSLHALLAVIARNGLQGVVFLSGDHHLSSESRIELFRDDKLVATAWSIHSSAMYAPYPFANASEAQFAEDDEFDVIDPRNANVRWRCKVKTAFHPGDGFAVITVGSPPAPGQGEPPQKSPYTVWWERPPSPTISA